MPQNYPTQQSFSDPSAKTRDIEEKLRLLKERVLLISQTFIEEREKTFIEIQEIKKAIFQLKEEGIKIKEILQRTAEQLNNTARKEELSILQRQFDLFRK